MKQIFKNIYLTNQFYLGVSILVALFLFSYLSASLFEITKLLLYIGIALVSIDFLLLFLTKGYLKGKRQLPTKLSNGDYNSIYIQLENNYSFSVRTKIIDELPFQFQKRNFLIKRNLKSYKKETVTYQIRPIKRGVYEFGSLHIYAQSNLGILSRRFSFDTPSEVAVYPSFLQLRKFELIAFSNRLQEYGLKKIRKIGHTLEFEQIKEYVSGDDIRDINWKATAKKGQLMVNQFQDEKSQPIYSVIDKGRIMKMPFRKLSLLDYAINASLVISGVAIKKQDKAGIFTFSKQIENKVLADRKSGQMHRILETLYRIKTNFVESDFSRLYVYIKRNITQRSLLLLYTNFETMDALERQLPYLKAIAKHHLLVVIFFENTELTQYVLNDTKSTQAIFNQTIAEKFIYEKQRIVKELYKHGIQSVLTKPENLTINTLNKYLEIKARGLL